MFAPAPVSPRGCFRRKLGGVGCEEARATMSTRDDNLASNPILSPPFTHPPRPGGDDSYTRSSNGERASARARRVDIQSSRITRALSDLRTAAGFLSSGLALARPEFGIPRVNTGTAAPFPPPFLGPACRLISSAAKSACER